MDVIGRTDPRRSVGVVGQLPCRARYLRTPCQRGPCQRRLAARSWIKPWSHCDLVLSRQGLQNEATAGFGRSQAFIAGLLRQFPDSSVFPSDLAWFEDQIADLRN